MTSPALSSANDDIPAWAVRLEAKVDVALGQHAGRLDRHDEIREDHETRLRALEAKSTVAPWQHWTAFLGIVTALGVVGALIFQTYDHLT